LLRRFLFRFVLLVLTIGALKNHSRHLPSLLVLPNRRVDHHTEVDLHKHEDQQYNRVRQVLLHHWDPFNRLKREYLCSSPHEDANDHNELANERVHAHARIEPQLGIVLECLHCPECLEDGHDEEEGENVEDQNDLDGVLVFYAEATFGLLFLYDLGGSFTSGGFNLPGLVFELVFNLGLNLFVVF
jgi:hypothetical protein